MTREEAIGLLDNLIGFIEDNQNNDYDTAIKMAIKALEAEPCEDTISRKAAIDAADKIIERDTSGNNAVVNAMIAWSVYIGALPSAQAEIVRCGGCRYFEDLDLSGYCNNPETYAIKTDSDFGCVLGERRSDE